MNVKLIRATAIVETVLGLAAAVFCAYLLTYPMHAQPGDAFGGLMVFLAGALLAPLCLLLLFAAWKLKGAVRFRWPLHLLLLGAACGLMMEIARQL